MLWTSRSVPAFYTSCFSQTNSAPFVYSCSIIRYTFWLFIADIYVNFSGIRKYLLIPNYFISSYYYFLFSLLHLFVVIYNIYSGSCVLSFLDVASKIWKYIPSLFCYTHTHTLSLCFFYSVFLAITWKDCGWIWKPVPDVTRSRTVHFRGRRCDASRRDR